MGLNYERRQRMGLIEEDRGGATPVAKIEYVNRPLFNPDTGAEVVAQILDDQILVSSLHTPLEQRDAVNRAISQLSSF